MAVLAVSSEYSTGMIRITLAAMPRRLTVLAAKAAVVTGLVLAAGPWPAGPAGRAAHPARARLHPGARLPAADPGARTGAACHRGSVLYLALIALLSLGVAAAVRDSAVAIGLVLGVLYLFPVVASRGRQPDWQRHLVQVGPMTAGLNIQATTGLRSLPLAPWQGLAVLAAWAAGALLAGALVFRFRDA